MEGFVRSLLHPAGYAPASRRKQLRSTLLISLCWSTVTDIAGSMTLGSSQIHGSTFASDRFLFVCREFCGLPLTACDVVNRNSFSYDLSEEFGTFDYNRNSIPCVEVWYLKGQADCVGLCLVFLQAVQLGTLKLA